MPDLSTIETDATAEAAKVKAEVLTEVAALESAVMAELAKVRAEINTPTGHMILAVAIFVGGVFTGHFL